MGASRLLSDLRAAGFNLRPDGDRLLVWPASRLNDGLRAEIRKHKAGLLALLGDSGAMHTWWRIRFADGRPTIECAYSPAASRAEVLAIHHDASDAEPFEPPVRRPDRPLSPCEEATIRRWLERIGETDRETIEAVIQQCRRDDGARRYFLRCAFVGKSAA